MVQKCVDEVCRHSNSLPVPLPGTDATCQQHFDACKQAEQRAVRSAAVQATAKSALDTFRS